MIAHVLFAVILNMVDGMVVVMSEFVFVLMVVFIRFRVGFLVALLLVMIVIIVALAIASQGKSFNALGLKNNIAIIANKIKK